MENYVKTLLFAYPFLERSIDTCAHHIQNKARLSYNGQIDTEKLVGYLAEEILRKRRMEWLQKCLNETLQALTKKERLLIEVYFFRDWKKIPILKEILVREKKGKAIGRKTMQLIKERTYQKIGECLSEKGVTKELFFKELVKMDVIQYIYNRFFT